MEKTGEIREGVTPPEKPREGEKQATAQSLESHAVNRLADAAADAKRQQDAARR